jgi:hypothetical protein
MNETEPTAPYTEPTPYVIKYIVAGTSQEYEAWLRRKGLDRRAYRYVTNPGMLYGMTNISGFFIGTYLNRLDIEEIQQQIEVSKLKLSKLVKVITQPYTVE